MKEYKTVLHPAYTTKPVDFVICDLCKRRNNYDNNWSKGNYEIQKVTMQYQDGCNFPEGGSSEWEEYHICPECWHDIVIPFMKSKGAVMTKRETDY